jgi:thiol-disulfide isomerase/thioredoxin
MKCQRSVFQVLLLLVLLLAAAIASAQDVVKLGLLDNATNAVGYYFPRQITLSATKPSAVRVAPSLPSIRYGLLTSADGSRTYAVALSEPPNGTPTLRVDTNGDGDLTNDPATMWAISSYGSGLSQGYGSASIDIGPAGATARVRIGMYRFDPKDTDRAAYANSLFYYADYARSGTVKIGSDSYAVILYDEKSAFDFRGAEVALLIDLNHDGVYTVMNEKVLAASPFNVDGTTREIRALSATGDSFQIAASTRVAAKMVPPPDLRVGKNAPTFTMVDIDGVTVNFPKDFAGSVVMLDFWATWCGPCMGEVPGLAALYAKYKTKGFAVLGVSLDQAGSEASGSAMRKVMKDNAMLWRQICDGKEWDAALAKMYLVDSIPHAFLVDGDTGAIIANGNLLRGDSLVKTVEAALRSKGKI